MNRVSATYLLVSKMSVKISEIDEVGGLAGYHLRNFDMRRYADEHGVQIKVAGETERNVDYGNFQGVSNLVAFIEYGSVREKDIEEFKKELKNKGKLTTEDLMPHLRVWQYDLHPKPQISKADNQAPLIRAEDFTDIQETEIDRLLRRNGIKI